MNGDQTPNDPRFLLQVRGLRVQFPVGDGRRIVAVDGVDLDVREGEVHGLVGESGSGKTALASAILGLVDPPGVVAGSEILWEGRNLLGMSERKLMEVRGRGIAMVFQNAPSSLNPAMRIGSQMAAVLRYRGGFNKKLISAETLRLLATVRLPDGDRVAASYPHELSGGMAQRVALAMALACKPRLLIADEPTSAVDATIAVQIIELLRELQRKFNLSLLLISHDLGVIARLSDRVSVMYLGRIVETGKTQDIYRQPPSALDILEHQCRFAPRCPKVFKRCREQDPPLMAVGAGVHKSACWLNENTGA